MKIGRALHKRAKGEKGFTLIELIVVIAVLGVLATLAVPRVIGVKKSAEDAADAASKKIIINALERYYAEKGEYPAPDNTNKLPEVLKTKGYLQDIPKKHDNTDWSYTLISTDDKKDYTLE